MSAIIQGSRVEKLSQEPLLTGDSCVLVIFGASGDLTKRKLMPGLYNLACESCMNPEFEVLGIGRTPMSAEEFRKKTGEAAAKSKDTRECSESGWEDFEQRLYYIVGDINDPTFYPELRNRLDEMEKGGSSPNHLFYVSTPASVARPIIEGLGAVGLNHRDDGWTRIVLERGNLDRIRRETTGDADADGDGSGQLHLSNQLWVEGASCIRDSAARLDAWRCHAIYAPRRSRGGVAHHCAD